MDNEVSQKLVQYLGTLESAVKTGSDFVVEQAPLVLQELLVRERVLTSLAIAVSLVSAIACIYFFKKLIIYIEKDDPTRGIPAGALMAFSGVLGFALMCENFSDFITCWFAPRVFILEQIKHYL